MDGLEEFNEEKQRAKVAAGFKGGPFFQKPILAPSMSFVDGVPAEVKATSGQVNAISGGVTHDPWNFRYPNSKMK